MASHDPCMDDDCPCYLSGRESMRTDYLLASSSLVEAATNLVRTITEADDPVEVAQPAARSEGSDR